MANVNPTTLAASTQYGGLFSASTTAASVALDPNRPYSIHHTGYNSGGSAAADDVILGLNAAPAAYTRESVAAGNKLVLKSATAITVGAGVSTLYIAVVSGGGAPMLNIVPGESDFGADH